VPRRSLLQTKYRRNARMPARGIVTMELSPAAGGSGALATWLV
jgi:hypothetical protein